MNQMHHGRRIVVMSGSTQRNEKPGSQERARLQPAARRIVVIRNGQVVRSRPPGNSSA
jgi:hypothetical protein